MKKRGRRIGGQLVAVGEPEKDKGLLSRHSNLRKKGKGGGRTSVTKAAVCTEVEVAQPVWGRSA